MGVKPMRGQVVVRELDDVPSATLWTPEQGQRQIHTHRGVVLALGEPARTPVTWDGKGGHEVPFGFSVGDTVQYHFVHHREAWTMTWPEDGLPCTYLAQQNVDAVIEP